MILALFTITMFVSAALLFMIQPLFARMVLPLLGGSPAVWNTAVVCYQALLLGGYLYVHRLSRLALRRQVLIHAVLLVLPILVLPIAIPAGWRPPADTNPIPWLIALLLMAAGLPYLVVSTSSPLLQSWFARTGHPSAHDPYFLYAASNLGSMLGLLGYPLLLEPTLRLAEQSRLWALGFGLLAILVLGCAAVVWRAPAGVPAPAAPLAAQAQTPPVGWLRRARWIVLAFVPSSLMLSVTTYLSTNIAPLPLLWVIPLALYLLTFTLVFARRPLLPHGVMRRALPIVLLPQVVVIAMGGVEPLWLLIALYLLSFFIVSMVCHGELAADRPPAARLTEFYLWMSLGGVLGGMFNALLAPLVFTAVTEYPLVLAIAALLPAWHPRATEASELAPPIWRDLGMVAALSALVVALIIGTRRAGLEGSVSAGLQFGVPALICFSFSRKALRFGLGVAVLLLAGTLSLPQPGQLLYAERSFFGIHRVLYDTERSTHSLIHGNILHGLQSLNPAQRRTPLAYYYPTGPLGQLMAAHQPQRIAVVGLGAGATACYVRPGQAWTFYEIDPTVVKIASDPRFFTFLQDCAPGARIVLGDARLALAEAPAAGYDLIVLDAYSGDSVPVHLLTREALQLYLDKLAPGGILAFHTSNLFFDLSPVVAGLAADAGVLAYVQDDLRIAPEEGDLGKFASQWTIIVRTSADASLLAADARWQPIQAQPGLRVWTDDYSSILSVLK